MVVATNLAPADRTALALRLRHYHLDFTLGAGGHFKEALVLAVGEEGASQIMRQDPWRALAKRVTPATLAALLKDERPETIGIVLGKLPAVYSSDLLALLPEQARAQSIERLTRSGAVAAAAAADALAAALEESLSNGPGDSDQQAGVKAAAAMLNRLDTEAALAIVEQLRATEPACAAALEREMFHFEDLLKLEGRVLERILSEVPTDKLAVAPQGTTPRTARRHLWRAHRSGQADGHAGARRLRQRRRH